LRRHPCAKWTVTGRPAKPDSILLGALIDPGADKADLFRRERFRRWTKSAWATGSARTTAAGPAGRRAARTTGPSRTTARTTRTTARTTRTTAARTRAEFGRHRDVIIHPSRRRNDQTLLTVSRNHHFAIFTTFKNGFQAVQAQVGLGFLWSVASEAGGFEHWPNILGVGDTAGAGRRRKLANIDFFDVPLVVGSERAGRSCQSQKGECRYFGHMCVVNRRQCWRFSAGRQEGAL
jgi:hypothetical protein